MGIGGWCLGFVWGWLAGYRLTPWRASIPVACVFLVSTALVGAETAWFLGARGVTSFLAGSALSAAMHAAWRHHLART